MPNSNKDVSHKVSLIRKKIFFDQDAYDVLKDTSDNTGDGFSIILNTLILKYLPYGYFDQDTNQDKDGE